MPNNEIFSWMTKNSLYEKFDENKCTTDNIFNVFRFEVEEED
jgi:hypothetical protein